MTSLSDVEAYLARLEKSQPSKLDLLHAGNQTPEEQAELKAKMDRLVERWALIKVIIPGGMTVQDFEAIITQAFDDFTTNASDDEGGPTWQVAATMDVIEVEGDVDVTDESVTFFKPGEADPALKWRHPRLQSAGGDNRITKFMHNRGYELELLGEDADETTITFVLGDPEDKP